MATQRTKRRGIGLLGVVFIVFLVLKLAGIGEVAHWSWWWVTAPLWMPTALFCAFFGGIAILGLITVIIAAILERK